MGCWIGERVFIIVRRIMIRIIVRVVGVVGVIFGGVIIVVGGLLGFMGLWAMILG
jgi:hypothetical protein